MLPCFMISSFTLLALPDEGSLERQSGRSPRLSSLCALSVSARNSLRAPFNNSTFRFSTLQTIASLTPFLDYPRVSEASKQFPFFPQQVTIRHAAPPATPFPSCDYANFPSHTRWGHILQAGSSLSSPGFWVCLPAPVATRFSWGQSRVPYPL
jgi:hypothetical protein